MGNREELQKRKSVRAQKNSEALLKTKGTERREERLRNGAKEKNDIQKPLTGFEPIANKTAPDEVMRLENSYGNIAFGGDAANGLSIIISEKRRHNSVAIGEKKKRLQESRERSRKLGRGKYAFNEEQGATVFRYNSNATKNEILAGMRAQVTRKPDATVDQMVPFLSMRDGRSVSDRDELLLVHRERMFEQRLVQALETVRSMPEKKRSSEGIFALQETEISAILGDGAEEETDEIENPDDLELL